MSPAALPFGAHINHAANALSRTCTSASAPYCLANVADGSQPTVNVIEHFLEDVRRHGQYTGVCGLGVRLQGVSNPHMRQHYGLSPRGSNGMRVTYVAKLSPAHSFLRVDDILLSVDGIEVHYIDLSMRF